MKRFLLILINSMIVFSMLLGLCACGNGGRDETESESAKGTATETSGESRETETDIEKDPELPSGTPVLSVTYQYVDGAYVQTYDVGLVEGDTSTVQEAGLYSEGSLVLTDSVMSYVSTLDDTDPPVSTWVRHKDQVNVGIMIAINRCTKSYLQKDPSNYDDIQKEKSGDYIVHTPNVAWYMVPSEDWNDYVVTNLDRLVQKYDLPFIVLEEPEMWHRSGYSQSFKEEWKNYYGTDWEDQTSSPSAWYRSMKLKTYLFERLLLRIGEELSAKYPDLKIYIASHSTLSYNAWSITAGLDSYMSLGVLDGFIGQTWSDTISTNVLYNGGTARYAFESAYLEYASYIASQYGTDFYALADPMADNQGFTEADCRKLYLESIAGMLMTPAIQRFEIMPWVTRAFTGVSSEYKTIQMNIQKMQKDLVGRDVTLTAGTPGIAYLTSDSLSWITAGNNWAPNSSEGFYGITMPLIRSGIPVSFISLDNLTDARTLKDVKLLILTLDNLLPAKPENFEALAEWVRGGGTLMVVSGYSRYWEIEDLWWFEYGTPLDALFASLGIDGIDYSVGTSSTSLYGASLVSSMSQYTLSFKNLPDSARELFSSGGKTIGFSDPVGKGQLRVIGVSPAGFGYTARGTEIVQRLLEDAIDDMPSNLIYTDSPSMTVRRGPYVIHHAFTEGELSGLYIDLYDANLSILEDPYVQGNTSKILFDVDGVDVSGPTLAFTGGRLEELKEESLKTTFRITGPTATYVASRLFCPDGLYPATIEGRDAQGNSVFVEYDWNNAYDSLYLKSDLPSGGVTYIVTWSDEPVEDGCNYETVWGSVLTSNLNLDKDYLIENTAMANGAQRYCDNNTHLIYKFDISGWNDPTFYLSVSQNYIIEVSPDGSDWQMIYDYSEGGKVPLLKNADNKTIVSLRPGQYGIEEDFYIRIRNCHPETGWGGSVYMITWMYVVYKD